ncbi:MFS transporter [Streptomyces sp. NPDC085614]|uniref:MFS transporter n=1 Tax=Streptomyces sp. NPDC085614 TaxID=3365733 RepID=UPI0037D6F789
MQVNLPERPQPEPKSKKLNPSRRQEVSSLTIVRTRPPSRVATPVVWPLAAEFVSAFGSGLTAPLLVIYLHAVQGWELGPAAAVGSLGALASILGNPLGGLLADRLGTRTTAMSGLALAAGATAGLGIATQSWQIMIMILLLGFGVSIAVPATGTMLGRVTPARRAKFFGLYNLGLNFGLGAGGLVSALGSVVKCHAHIRSDARVTAAS